jgi:hypothetical protein
MIRTHHAQATNRRDQLFRRTPRLPRCLGLELPLSLPIRVPAIEELALHRLFLPQLRAAGISIPPVRMTDTSKKSALDRARRNEGRRACDPTSNRPLQRNCLLMHRITVALRPRPAKVRVTGLSPHKLPELNSTFVRFSIARIAASQTPEGRSSWAYSGKGSAVPAGALRAIRAFPILWVLGTEPKACRPVFIGRLSRHSAPHHPVRCVKWPGAVCRNSASGSARCASVELSQVGAVGNGRKYARRRDKHSWRPPGPARTTEAADCTKEVDQRCATRDSLGH